MLSFQSCAFGLVWLQGTIFSKTAMENYKELGPSLFKRSVTYSPAKRLGVPEEVCNSVVTVIAKLREMLSFSCALHCVGMGFPLSVIKHILHSFCLRSWNSELGVGIASWTSTLLSLSFLANTR